MKQILLTLLAALAFVSAQGQSLPNGSFENWAANPLNPFVQDPVNWQTFFNAGNIVRVTTGSQAGTSHVRLAGGNIFGQAFPGLLFNQYATTQRFSYLNGYFRKAGPIDDTITVGISYTDAGSSFDTTGAAGGAQTAIRVAAAWTPFNIALYVARPNAIIDSGAVVILVNGSGTGYELDNLVEANTPIGQPLGFDLVDTKPLFSVPGKPAMSLYPNPLAGNKNLTLGFGNVRPGRVNVGIYNTSGVRMSSFTAHIDGDLKAQLALPNLSAGLYVVVVQTGTQVVARRLSVR